MDHFHTRTHKLKGNISPDIQENIKYTTQIMQDCNDLVQKQFKIGIDHEISIYIVYINYYHNTPGANCTGSQNLFNACRIPLFTIDKKSFSYLFLSVKCGVMKEW